MLPLGERPQGAKGNFLRGGCDFLRTLQLDSPSGSKELRISQFVVVFVFIFLAPNALAPELKVSSTYGYSHLLSDSCARHTAELHFTCPLYT